MINANYKNLKQNYLFSDIARRVAAFSNENPDVKIIKMGIGDVTLPLCKSVVDAMQKASAEMGVKETFHGYGDEQGYAFLREAIKQYYATFGVKRDISEIFISDGAKSDLGNILDLFDTDIGVMIPDPVYPVYVDTNIMHGREITYLTSSSENGFLPTPDGRSFCGLIYICSPNNPTGAAYTREMLKKWVDYANATKSIILFDAAYESFIEQDDIPHSIFEIEGADECAIEFCSFSKTAGFTGTRCGYTVVPTALKRDGAEINPMWRRRQTTKFNGVAYIVQRGAEAVFTPEGRKEIEQNIAYYKANAKLIGDTLTSLGIEFYGGKNSPYIWLRCPSGMGSWEFFDLLLTKAGVVGTPGAGFGENGDGYFRLTAFSSRENTAEAMNRLAVLIQ